MAIFNSNQQTEISMNIGINLTHNPKVVGSNPAPATKQVEGFEGDYVFEAFLLF